MPLNWPDDKTLLINQSRALHARNMAQFVMQHAGDLPEVKPSSDGLAAYYFLDDADVDSVFIAQTISTLVIGAEQYSEFSIVCRWSGRIVEVRRAFGDMLFSLVYVWPQLLSSRTKTTQETVESALLAACRDEWLS